MDQQRHEMVLEKSYPTGIDEWYCPTCGRRLLMNYEPIFKKTVLDAGDEYVIHSGGKGGLNIGSVRATQMGVTSGKDESPVSSEDPTLAPWVTWLDEIDFENLWNED